MKIEINLTDQQLAEIAAKLTISKPKPKYFVPNEDEKYWYIGNDNNVYNSYWNNEETDRERLSFGNCYATKEEAELKAKHNHLYTKLIREIAELNGDWICDWSEWSRCKYFYRYNYGQKEFEIVEMSYVQHQPTELYMTKQTAETILSTWSKKDLYLALYGQELV